MGRQNEQNRRKFLFGNEECVIGADGQNLAKIPDHFSGRELGVFGVRDRRPDRGSAKKISDTQN